MSGPPTSEELRSVGHFKLLSRVGAGGMGVVYRAQDTKLGRTVAVKVLPTAMTADPERRARFLREARSAAVIGHANVATVFEVGEEDGRIFIAMELVRGESLSARIASKTLAVDEALRLGLEIARGLAAAHEAGVVHRDLKPDNVMITDEGGIKILDFGLAKTRGMELEVDTSESESTATGMTGEGRVLGTPGYMSPEQGRGDPEVDARSDVFSFGVLLYELLTGTRPFSRKTPMQTIIATDRDPHAPASKVRSEVTDEIDAFLDRCLAKAPEKRFADGRALVTELRKLTKTSSGVQDKSEPRAAPPPPASEKSLLATADTLAGPKPKRRPWAIGAALLAVVGVGAALAYRTANPGSRAVQGGASSASASAPAPTATTDLPMPKSDNAEALKLYAGGLQSIRDGERESGVRMLESAVALDPSLGPAWLRIALVKWWDAPVKTRGAIRNAMAQRASMSPRDQDLLRATETMLETPYAYRERYRRLEEMTRRYPGDAEIAYYFAIADFELDFESPRGPELFARAADLDPKSALAPSDFAQYYAYLGQSKQAHALVDRSLAIAANAVAPLETRDMLFEQDGECEKLEADARRQISIHPENLPSYDRLAEAIASQGRPVETVEEVLAQKWARATPAEAKTLQLADRVRLAQLRGDFDASEKHALELQRALATVQYEEEQAPVWRALVETYEEIGSPDRAARVAEDFLRRRDAWVREPRAEDFAAAKDAVGLMIATARRGGRLAPADAAKRRDTFLREWAGRAASPPIGRYIWFYVWAQPAQTRDEAVEALREAEKYSPLPHFRPMSLALGIEGSTRFLAGELDKGLELLEQGARVCRVLSEPVRHTRLLLTLAAAREAKGDRAGACSALRVVQSRWGRARPKSITAAAAQERMRALSCSG